MNPLLLNIPTEFFVQASTGKGYVTEAAGATFRFAFEKSGVARVELQCAADNEESRRVAERCGFAFEGCSHQSHRKKAGAVVDTVWYGMLRSQWHGGQRFVRVFGEVGGVVSEEE